MISTKNGDNGLSSIDGKNCIPKNSLVFKTLGELDELHSWLSYIELESCDGSEAKDILRNSIITIQRIMSIVSGHDVVENDSGAIEKMELFISDKGNISDFESFVKCERQAKINISRAVCRRAERLLSEFWYTLKLVNYRNYGLDFINRLSDFLFVYGLDICDD